MLETLSMFRSRLILPLFVIGLIFFTSCATPKKVEKIVSGHYGEIPAIKSVPQSQNVKVVTELTKSSHEKKMTATVKKKVKVLFLLLYWHSHWKLETRLNYKIPVNQLSNSIYQFSKNAKISEKLKEGTLTLNIEEIPRTYSHHDDSRAVLLVEWSKFYLEPAGEDLVVSYSFTKEGQLTKTGRVEIKDPNKLYSFGYFQTLKSATNDYLDAYDNFYKNAGRMVLEKIAAEL